MKIALTPQNDTEKAILGKLHDGSREMSIKRGSFYETRGGWVRNGASDDSTMIVLRLHNEPTEPKGENHDQP